MAVRQYVRVPVRWNRLLLLAIATCLLITVALGLMNQAGQDLAAVLAIPIGIGSLLVAVAAWLYPRPAAAEDPVETAATALAQAQSEQWGAEYSARQVQDPYPLPVRWQVSPRAATVMASWASIRGSPDAEAISLDGTYDRIADVFSHPDSPRRLVIIGEPGAGKSMLALHLTLELLRRRTATEPVPVLLALWGWDPRRPLDHWIAQRLATDNRHLARRTRAPDGTSRTIAHELVARRRILPILDGLDELAPAQQAAALLAIAAAASAGRQFVLTCRTVPYEHAVADVAPLAATPVVEMQPLRPADVARYLVDGTDNPVPRWDRVVDRLNSGADGPLVAALATPLMAWLTRAVYRHRATLPDDLLDRTWATSREGIESHLLDSLVPAVYTAAVGGRRPRSPAEAQDARRHLGYLASHLQRQQTYDLAWWRFRAIPLPGLMTLAALGAGAPTALLGLALLNHQSLNLASGLLAGTLAAVMSARPPQRITFRRPRTSTLLARVGLGILIGSAIVLPLFSQLGLLRAVVSMLVIGIPIGLLVVLTGIADDGLRAITPRVLLAEDRTASLAIGVPVGILYGSLVTPTSFAGLAWLLDASVPWTALAAIFLAGLLAGLSIGLSGSWATFCLSRLLFFLTRRTPLRLVAFLEEAHDRGLLRQVGGVYQFRHNRLQDHLASCHTTGFRPPPGAGAR